MPTVGVRQARVFLAVADSLSVTGAAGTLNRSQTSVTKSLHDLESELEAKLFDRSSKGVSLTAFGDCLLARAKEARDVFASAQELVPPVLMQQPSSIDRFFRMDVSDRWLDAFLAVSEQQSIAAAAEQLGLTPAAVSSSLRKLEDTLCMSLFERTPTAVVPTSFGLSIARHIKLARSHLRSAVDEIAGLQGVRRGRIVIGTLPFGRTIIVPRALIQLLKDYPVLEISTVEGRYEDLVSGIRCGDIDLIVGALRGNGPDSDLIEEPLLEQKLAPVVRAGHPLIGKKVGWEELLSYDWILPRKGTPTRTLFERAVADTHMESPPHIIETSAMTMVRGLLIESDRVTVLSRQQLRFEQEMGVLAELPFELPETERSIGITRRKIGTLSPAASLLVEELREVASSFDLS